MKQKWYLQTWLIAILFALWVFIIPLVAGIVLLVLHYSNNKKMLAALELEKQQEQSIINTKLQELEKKRQELGLITLEQVQRQISDEKSKFNNDIEHEKQRFAETKSRLEADISRLQNDKEIEKQKIIREAAEQSRQLQQEILNSENELSTIEANVTEKHEALIKIEKSLKTQTNKLNRSKELYKAIEYSLSAYVNIEPLSSQVLLPSSQNSLIDELSPNIFLKLHCMDIKDLKKAYRDNDKQITKILEQYSSRYTTKANQTIYKLMVIALRAELQNILYNLKYQKLDSSIDDIVGMTQKYLQIAGEGNQSIAGTLAKFIGEIEYLFINSVKIEYNYYVKKEQAKQEQAAIRAQMRQEAEERKALAAERAKVEEEEKKYHSEIENINMQIANNASSEEVEKLQRRIVELQSQLSDVTIKKEEIVNLQNGKAGNVYIISNLGSFGENVFKIGMTRRIDPQDRVNELGDASVPFRFDVHSFIFSEDAVSLESKLHEALNSKRINKVNMRKEFFGVTIDELEKLVDEVAPASEFNKTMLAEEFRQSISTDEAYNNEYAMEAG